MIVFPAIDLQQGRCVRLRQGLKEEATVYGENPLAMARFLEAQGARYLHIVDLDGAFDGHGAQQALIVRMKDAVSIPVQVGGGIRTMETAAYYLENGVSRIIIGSMAVEDPAFINGLLSKYGERVAVSVDAKQGKVATRGWTEATALEAVPFIRELKEKGLRTVIYTDISRDGMLSGPNLEELQKVQVIGDLEVIASGGISSVADFKALQAMGLYGAITGKALYEGRFTLPELLQTLAE